MTESRRISQLLETMEEQDFWSEFLDIYKSHPCLWDTSSPYYRDQHFKRTAYNMLVDKYKQLHPAVDIRQVKKKIDSFRAGYRRECKKVIEMKKSCPCTEYRPTLWYYEKFSFLKQLEEGNRENTSELEQNADFSLIDSSIKSELDDDITIDEKPLPSPTRSPPPISPPMKKAKLLCQTTTEPVNIQPSTSKNEAQDESAYFCKHLSVQMRELKTMQKYIAQKLISEVMFRARINQLTVNSTIDLGSTIRISDEALPSYLTVKQEINSSEDEL